MILISFLLSFHVHAVTLEEAFVSALQKNEEAAKTKESVKQAEEKLSQTKSAIFPDIALTGNHLIQTRLDNAVAREFFPESQTTAALTLTQPLFRGFREFKALSQRKHALQSEIHRRTASLLQVYEQVAANYLDVLAQEQDLKNLTEQRALYAQRIKDLQARIRRGESNATEALTAQSTEAALEAEMHLVQAKLRASRERFNYLTALPTNTPLADTIEASEAYKLGPLENYLQKIENRPDIQSAIEMTEAADSGVGFASGAHWPSLDLLGNYYLKRPPGITSDIKWDVQLRFTLPLFEGGLRASEVREASSALRESALELSRLRREAEATIRSLYENAKSRELQLSALKRAAELAEKNYQVLQRDFRRGLSRSIDVQLAMTEYRSVRRNYDQARYLARLDQIRLESAAGILPEALKKEL